MNRLICFVIAVSTGVVPCSRAAISVTAAGAGPLGFETTPSSTEFSTGVLPGDGTTFSTWGQIDVAVGTVGATNIVLMLQTTATWPPSQYALGFRHNITCDCLQSRPSAGAAHLLLATLQNDSDTPIVAFALSYDFSVYVPQIRELPGYRVYYSATGTPGSWILIPELSGTETIGRVSGMITPTAPWESGQRFYLLWVDDNAPSNNPAYTIDNLTITPSVTLSVQSIDGGILLSWPAFATGFEAEATSALGPAAIWSPLDGTVVVSNGLNTVTIATSGDSRFFRLRKP